MKPDDVPARASAAKDAGAGRAGPDVLVMPEPKLSRAFVCPDCGQSLALDYDPSRDRQPMPAMFECPACEAGHIVDLPGTLKQARKQA